jgi:hypothetical protein
MQIRAYVAWTSAQLYCVKQQWFKFVTVIFPLSKSAISLNSEVLKEKKVWVWWSWCTRFAVLQEPTNTWWHPEISFWGREHRRKEYPKGSKEEGVRVSKSIAWIFVEGPRCFIFLLAPIPANIFNKNLFNVVSFSLHMSHPHCISSTPMFNFTFFSKGGRGGCKFSPHPRTWRNSQHRAAGYSQKTVNFMLNSLLPIFCLSVFLSLALSPSRLLSLAIPAFSILIRFFLCAFGRQEFFSFDARAHAHCAGEKNLRSIRGTGAKSLPSGRLDVVWVGVS